MRKRNDLRNQSIQLCSSRDVLEYYLCQAMIRIGKIVATHGLKGGVILAHILGESNWLKENMVLFLELQKNSRIPYFVVQAKGIQDEEAILQLDEVDTVEAAKRLIGKQVYVTEAILPETDKSSPLLWIGFQVVDSELGTIGEVEDVFQTGHQWIARVNYLGKEALLPMVKPMIIEISIRNKFIRMRLPEGILEI
ncbi:MAG: 16S rRNA processing protein RimM [Bacteroidetes bacterium]|nr:16S rRNA processing protein RimM [Bacteroidota bacterium]